MTPSQARQPRFMTFVALPAPARPPGAEVAARLAARFLAFAARAEAVAAPEGGTVLLAGGRTLIVTPVDMPLPAECFHDDAHQRGWPGWLEAARAQRAHLLVATLDTAAGTPSAVQGAALVFATAAVLCELTPALGVSWAANRLFLAPDAARQAAAAMRPDQLPLPELIRPLWQADDPKAPRALGLVTLGLGPFVGREVEHPPTGEPPGAVYERVLNLCLYLMRAGPVIKDGDTIGQTAAQRITVRLAEREGVPVYRLVFAAA